MDCSGRVAAVIVGSTLLTAGFISSSIVPPPEARAETCTIGACPSGGEDSFSGQALFTTKGKVFDPGGSGGGSGPEGSWNVRQQCELGGLYTCQEGMRCDSDDNGSQDARYMEVRFLAEGSSQWKRVGGYCEGEEEPVSIQDIGEQVEAKWKEYVPELKPTMEPPNRRSLVGLRSVFHSGQKESFGPVSIPVYEFSIQLSAKGTWYWKFEPDAGEKKFTIPGSHYPDKRVGYTYENTGKYSPTVRTEWNGQFTVGGKGPYEIPDLAFQQPVALPINVVEKMDVIGD